VLIPLVSFILKADLLYKFKFHKIEGRGFLWVLATQLSFILKALLYKFKSQGRSTQIGPFSVILKADLIRKGT